MLEEGIISPFYLDKIRDDQGTRVPSALSMSILYYFTKYYTTHILYDCYCIIINAAYFLTQIHIPLSIIYFILRII